MQLKERDQLEDLGVDGRTITVTEWYRTWRPIHCDNF
jgi:hypothetical protein